MDDARTDYVNVVNGAQTLLCTGTHSMGVCIVIYYAAATYSCYVLKHETIKHK
jgi:hypothetical protein